MFSGVFQMSLTHRDVPQEMPWMKDLARETGRMVTFDLQQIDENPELYKEDLSDFQNVLDSERSLFAQQDARIASQGRRTGQLIELYRALGGGWQAGPGGFIDEETRRQMEQRTDWDGLLDADRQEIVDYDR